MDQAKRAKIYTPSSHLALQWTESAASISGCQPFGVTEPRFSPVLA